MCYGINKQNELLNNDVDNMLNSVLAQSTCMMYMNIMLNE